MNYRFCRDFKRLRLEVYWFDLLIKTETFLDLLQMKQKREKVLK